MLWIDGGAQIIAEAASVAPDAGLTAMDTTAPGANLAAFYVSSGKAVAKKATTLTASVASVAAGSPVTLSVQAGEAVTFSVGGPDGPTAQTVQPDAGGMCSWSFTPAAPGTYTVAAVGLTTYSDAATVAAS